MRDISFGPRAALALSRMASNVEYEKNFIMTIVISGLFMKEKNVKSFELLHYYSIIDSNYRV